MFPETTSTAGFRYVPSPVLRFEVPSARDIHRSKCSTLTKMEREDEHRFAGSVKAVVKKPVFSGLHGKIGEASILFAASQRRDQIYPACDNRAGGKGEEKNHLRNRH